MKVTRLDHLVLTVRNLDATVDFYVRVLGMEEVRFGNNRRALAFGEQKINLHLAGFEFEPKAHIAMPGSADLCLITDATAKEIADHLYYLGVPIEMGPVTRTGALGPITSFYFRDPDQNLIELSTYRQ